MIINLTFRKFLLKNSTSQPEPKLKERVYPHVNIPADRLSVCVLARSKQNALDWGTEGPIRIPSSMYRRDTANDHQPQD